MPTYEFRCLACGHQFELFMSISEKEKGLDLVCPKCGEGNIAEVFGALMVMHKTGEVVPTGGSCCSRQSRR